MRDLLVRLICALILIPSPSLYSADYTCNSGTYTAKNCDNGTLFTGDTITSVAGASITPAANTYFFHAENSSTTYTNNADITDLRYNYFLQNGNITGTSFTNTATIDIATNSGAILLDSVAVMDTFNNSGTITTTTGVVFSIYGTDFFMMMDGAKVSNFINTGTFNSDLAYHISLNQNDYGIGSEVARITNMYNSQGGSNALTIYGGMPDNYNIIIDSSLSYGKLEITTNNGTSMDFDIDSTRSTLSAGTYTDVLTGVTDAKLGATRSGTVGGFNWTIALQSGSSTVWDLVLQSARTSYTARISSSSLSVIAQVLENINTAGSNASLTTALDALSESELIKAVNQIQGNVVEAMKSFSGKNINNFNQTLNTALKIGPVNTFAPIPSTTNSINFTSASIYPNSNESLLSTPQEAMSFIDMAAYFENFNSMLSTEQEGNTTFIRSYANVNDQKKIDNDVGYQTRSGGFVYGVNREVEDTLNQGWALGVSASDTQFDESYGSSTGWNVHGAVFQQKDYSDYSFSSRLGIFYDQYDLTRKVTEGLNETLVSTNANYGVTWNGTLNWPDQLPNNNSWSVQPFASLDVSYVRQGKINETGGSQALSVAANDLQLASPSLGVNATKVVEDNDLFLKSLNLNLSGTIESKLSGTSTLATIKSTSSNFDIVDDQKENSSLSLGVDWITLNKSQDSELILGYSLTYSQQLENLSNQVMLTYKKSF
jgi:uncharacterized protein with beta-barrel porin domain